MSALERCWAKGVSECGERISGEHDFTRRVFPDVNVTVQATSPTPEGQRDPHSEQLVAEGLCRRHEAELSSLDDGLLDLVNSIREIERLRGVRSKTPKNWPAHRLTVDGVAVERCVLKMVMNHAVAQKRALNDWQPPDWLARVIVGTESLKPGCGLGVVVRVGDSIIDRERIGFTFVQSEGGGPYQSVILELRQGLRLVCSWATPVHSLGELRLLETRYHAANDVLWHPRRVSFSNGELDLGVSLDFDWSGKWTANKNPAVAALREKFAPPRAEVVASARRPVA